MRLQEAFEAHAAASAEQTRRTEGAGASSALRGALFGPWAPEEERHYRKLQAKLGRLKEKGASF